MAKKILFLQFIQNLFFSSFYNLSYYFIFHKIVLFSCVILNLVIILPSKYPTDKENKCMVQYYGYLLRVLNKELNFQNIIFRSCH